MCIICVDFDKGRLTTREARRALGEMVVSLEKKHVDEIERALAIAEQAEASQAALAAAKPAPVVP
jgi:hypothetical protein